MKTNQIKPPSGSRHKRKRVGRGDASGHGGTSTRGHKGHKSRKGFSLSSNFEGGQMPLIRRLPKRGFTYVKRNVYEIVNLDGISKRFDEGVVVTPDMMAEKRLVRKGRKVKVLGTGILDKKLDIKADYFSESAKKKIEKAGGSAIICS